MSVAYVGLEVQMHGLRQTRPGATAEDIRSEVQRLLLLHFTPESSSDIDVEVEESAG